uniref:Uncharacterized protein n=1 Tax=Gopherus agassizii TaxID=38772 RepID=A0A452H2X3_9SAUR
MMSGKCIAALFLVLGSSLGSGSCGKVLVWPADYSHWLNVKSILEELADRGHEVTVLLSSSFLGIDPTRPSPFNFEVIPMPFTKEDMASLLEDFLHMWLYELPNFSYWETTSRLCNLISRMRSVNKATCDSVVWNEELMKMLREATFDILLADPLVLGGELVAEKLGIPFVYTIRFSIGSTVERLCGELPAPPSYVPASMGSLTDRMSFMERMKNMFFYALQDVLFHQVFWREWSQYYSDVLGKAALVCRDCVFTVGCIVDPCPILQLPSQPLPQLLPELAKSSLWGQGSACTQGWGRVIRIVPPSALQFPRER